MNIALALASAILQVLVFPNAGLTWLAPLALAPLLVAVAREPRPWRRFLMGEAAGFVYWFGVCYWIQTVLEVHGGMSAGLSWLAFLLFCTAKALHMAVFAWLAGRLMPRWYAIPAVAALWTGLERTHAPLGFPWLALGNAGADMSLPARLAPLAGVYGLSFVFVMLNAGAALLLLRRPRRQLAWLALLGALWVLPELPRKQAPDRSAVVLQPNVADSDDWTGEKSEAFQNRLVLQSLKLALSAGAARPDLIVWPEMPAPLYIDRDFRFRDRLLQLARLARAPVLATVIAYTPRGEPLNSAVLVSARGEMVDRYDKIQLVPFGEFVPPLFGWVNRVTGETGDFAPGSRVVVFPAGDTKLGAFICYESAFPHLVRQFARGGAGWFVNLSNDGYFGHSAAREQHLALVRMRAIENRRWIVRATNDGITAVLDPAGRIVQRLDPYRETAFRAGFTSLVETTFYTRHGDWFAWLCLLNSLSLTYPGFFRRKKPG
ncbi:MAG: apolipoprotein N-acyltransferase [Acidobacteria bacterium]|nr:apolipoprotein N-acyltransferase [Acidobacteriota bacterium]